MELEEAIKLIDWLKFELKFIKGTDKKMTEKLQLSNQAIEKILSELTNSIPKEVIEKEIKEYDTFIEEFEKKILESNGEEKKHYEKIKYDYIMQRFALNQLLNKE